MRIVVPVKQVPDTTEVRMDSETNTLVREGVDSIVNPFDTYAVEEAVRVKERLNLDASITVLTMGPPQAESALRECLAVGADEAALVTDRAFAGSDTWATSLVLATAIRHIGFDLVICGKQAIDGDTAQVGPGISVHLDVPQATYVGKVEEITPGKAVVLRLVEEGHERIELPLPCLWTVTKEINEPRLPSLRGKMRAKKAEIRKLTAEELGLKAKAVGLDGSPTRVVRIFSPLPRAGGEVFTGEADECVAKLVAALTEGQVV